MGLLTGDDMVFKVCGSCGAFNVEHQIVEGEQGWATAVCGGCGAGVPFRRLPLFVMTGSSGAGKTTTCRLLMRSLPECVVLESDTLWGSIDMAGEGSLPRYWDTWLRLVMNIHQAERPVLLCGTVVPSVIESLPSQSYIAGTYYLALTCDDAELEQRLHARPAWRQSGSDDFVRDHVTFNRWFRSKTDPDQPSITLIDTTHATGDETAAEVRQWVRNRLSDELM